MKPLPTLLLALLLSLASSKGELASLLPYGGGSDTPFIELGPPATQLDWADYLESHVFPNLPLSGSGDREGVVEVNGMITLDREVLVPRRVTIIGKWPPRMHAGGSCGFRPAEGFVGDRLLRWEPGVKRNGTLTWYSNFGAGLVNIFLECSPPHGPLISGAQFVGSQQTSTIDTVIVRNFGPNIGLEIAGDVYVVRRVLCDSGLRGQGIAISSFGSRLVSIDFESITAHNCNAGLRIFDCEFIRGRTLETETTTYPLDFRYHARHCEFAGIRALHTDTLARISWSKWKGSSWGLRLEGQTDPKKGPSIILVPDKVQSEKTDDGVSKILEKKTVPNDFQIKDRLN